MQRKSDGERKNNGTEFHIDSFVLSAGNFISDQYLQSELKLINLLSNISFGSTVEYIYNPLSYAYDVHSQFIRKFCSGKKDLLFLGMNPGPWGMMQNGIPFGEVTAVQDFLGLSGIIKKPEKEHPSKPVLGLACKRTEVSGKRFWSLANALGAGDPGKFFAHAFVHNYFPLCLISAQGKNVTPPELKTDIQKIIEVACDTSLNEILTLLEVKVVVAIGRFAEKRVQNIIHKNGIRHIKVVFIPHPSPRNPASNRDWLISTKELIIEYDLAHYFAL